MKPPREVRFRRAAAGLCALLLLMLLLPLAGAEEEIRLPLSKGDRGDAVREAKERLYELGYYRSAEFNNQYNEDMATRVRYFQETNGLPATEELDADTTALLWSGAALPKPRTLQPLATPAPKTEPDWPERDGEGFLAGDGEYVYENEEEGLWVYLTDSLQIRISREEDSSVPLIWFETDIRTRNGEGFRTVMTDPEHPGKKYRYPADIAKDAGMVLGFSDDFYAERMNKKLRVGIIIREGRILSDETNAKRGTHLPNLDMMALYPDGDMKVWECNERTAEELLAEGAVNVFSFGPILIRDGVVEEMLYGSAYKSLEPRHALGIIEPGHYFLLSVTGRKEKDSVGCTLQRMAEHMQSRGVQQALNLDGGNTMALIFRGRMLNRPALYQNNRNVRTMTSLIGIGTMGQE